MMKGEIELTEKDCVALGLLKNAVLRMYQEGDLPSRGNVERACVFRVGVYFQELVKDSIFKGLSVDCEYNRKGSGKDSKPMHRCLECGREKEKAIPDLLLHKRDDNTRNICVVECKINTTEDDTVKLKKFTDPNGEYGYSLGVYVNLKSKEPVYTLFKNGDEQK